MTTTQTAPDWFVPDKALTSYVNRDFEYDCEFKQEELKWFNFNITTPTETEQEAKEREMATRQQIQLGILRVQAPQPQPEPQQQPQQNRPNVQPPQHALDPEIARAMECRITPAFISMLDGKAVDMQTLDQTQPIHQMAPQEVKKTAIDSLADQFVNQQKIQKEKYKFSLTGKKIGKKDPCPCGSGQAFFRCHGK